MTVSEMVNVRRVAFIKMMHFPDEWEKWEMYPDELFQIQFGGYTPGNEDAPEHFRYGAFLWWLSQNLSHQQKERIQRLIELDPDQLMVSDIRKRLKL